MSPRRSASQAHGSTPRCRRPSRPTALAPTAARLGRTAARSAGVADDEPRVALLGGHVVAVHRDGDASTRDDATHLDFRDRRRRQLALSGGWSRDRRLAPRVLRSDRPTPISSLHVRGRDGSQRTSSLCPASLGGRDGTTRTHARTQARARAASRRKMIAPRRHASCSRACASPRARRRVAPR